MLGKAIRASFERATGWNVYTIDPRGAKLERDLRVFLPHLDVRTIFDVGANVGQSAEYYLEAYPSATIYSFEPVSDTFAALKERFALHSRLRCFQVAFGNEAGEAEMALVGNSDQYRFVEHYNAGEGSVLTETVPVETVDHFCERHNIDDVNLLKIDTEGHDLAVLKGATRMLAEGRVDLVQVEVAMNSGNTLHVPIERVKKFMETRQYYMFGVYEQAGKWSSRSPVLRRANVVFLSPRLYSGYEDK